MQNFIYVQRGGYNYNYNYTLKTWGEVALGCGALGECTVLLQAGSTIFIVTRVLRLFSRLTSDSVTRVHAVTCGLQHKRGSRSWYSLVSCTTENMSYVCLWHVAVGACLFNSWRTVHR